MIDIRHLWGSAYYVVRDTGTSIVVLFRGTTLEEAQRFIERKC